MITVSKKDRVQLEILNVSKQEFVHFILFLFSNFFIRIEYFPFKRVRNVFDDFELDLSFDLGLYEVE
jgi:hypothetical protein